MIDETLGNISFGLGLAMGISQDQAFAMLMKARLREPKGSRFKPRTPHWATQADLFECHVADVLHRLGLNITMRTSTTPVPTAFDVISDSRELLYTRFSGTEYLALVGLRTGTFSLLFGHLKDGAPHVGGYPVSRTVAPVAGLIKSRFDGLVLKASFLLGCRTEPDDLFAGTNGRDAHERRG